ncbi:hypothetical protein ACP8HI_02105 [Paenibacillus sp. FA6]|uniref:hypothetical protein n=1 Tax=Paenibacillus sp. FA6 TaxID=3413029 RepID=UPI003F65EFD0
MGKQRKGRKRRRRIYKKDAPVVILASLTLILLCVWGGLYWSETSEKAIIADANVKEQSQQILQNEEALFIADSEGLIDIQANEQPSAIDEIKPMDSTVTANDEREKNTELSPFTDVPNPPDQTVTKSDKQTLTKPDTSSPMRSNTQSPTKLEEQSPTKPDEQSPTKLDEQSPTKSDEQSPTNSNAQTPMTSMKQVEPAVNQAQKYEQEIIKIHAKCTKDMNVVLSGAEMSSQQLDMRNPVNIQEWREKLTKEIATAESKCGDSFQEQMNNANDDSVSEKVIEEWRNSYNALKANLKKESEAKLQQLMGG